MTGSTADGSNWWETNAEPTSVPDASDWYYSTTGVSAGPVSLVQLRRLVTSGTLRADHHVRHSGWDKWWSVSDSAAIIGVDVTPGDPAPSGSGAAEASIPSAIEVGHEGTPPVDDPSAFVVGEVATFAQRLSSWLIDGAVLVLVLVLAINVLASGPAWSTLFVVIAYVGYTFGLRHFGHDTLGHVLVGLRVRDAATGAPSSWLASATRSAVVVLLALPLLMGLVGSVLGAFAHPRSIAWHDLVSGTVVVKDSNR